MGDIVITCGVGLAECIQVAGFERAGVCCVS